MGRLDTPPENAAEEVVNVVIQDGPRFEAAIPEEGIMAIDLLQVLNLLFGTFLYQFTRDGQTLQMDELITKSCLVSFNFEEFPTVFIPDEEIKTVNIGETSATVIVVKIKASVVYVVINEEKNWHLALPSDPQLFQTSIITEGVEVSIGQCEGLVWLRQQSTTGDGAVKWKVFLKRFTQASDWLAPGKRVLVRSHPPDTFLLIADFGTDQNPALKVWN